MSDDYCVLAIVVILTAAFLVFDHLHDRWAMRSAVEEADAMCGIVQWDIDTEDLHVGSKLYNMTLGWVVVVRMKPGTVWVRKDRA